MAELESNIKESLAQISHGVSDEKCFKENSDVLDIEAYSSDDFDKALERTIDLLMFNKNISRCTSCCHLRWSKWGRENNYSSCENGWSRRATILL